MAMDFGGIYPDPWDRGKLFDRRSRTPRNFYATPSVSVMSQ